MITKWQLLRTKTDPTVDDDFFGVATLPDEAICGSFSQDNGHSGIPWTGVEVVVLAMTAGRVQVANASLAGTVDLRLIEVVSRDTLITDPSLADGPVAVCTDVTVSVPLQEKAYFPLNGSTRFTIDVSNDASLPGGTNRIELWWRPVAR